MTPARCAFLRNLSPKSSPPSPSSLPFPRKRTSVSVSPSLLHLLSQLPSPPPPPPPPPSSPSPSTKPPIPFSAHSKSPHTHTAPPSQAEILLGKQARKEASKQARMPTPTRNLLLLLLFLAATSSCSQVADAGATEPPRMVPMAPAAGGEGFSGVVLNETRRRLGSFQLCAPCTCCGGPRGVCVLSPCCYAINCNIPNRPFGYCSFTPRSCDCLGCNL